MYSPTQMQTSPQITALGRVCEINLSGTSMEVRIFETAQNIIKAVKQDSQSPVVLQVQGFDSNPVYRGRKTRDPVYKARQRVLAIVAESVGPTKWLSDSLIEVRPTTVTPKPPTTTTSSLVPAWPRDEVAPAPTRGFISVRGRPRY